MATQDRRKKLTIDEINEYWLRLNQGAEQPSLHRIVNAVRVLDVALAESDSPMNNKLSGHVWSKIRDDLYDMLVTSFAGYFLVYSDLTGTPLEPGDKWPEQGTVEFYPERTNRRDDACPGSLSKLSPAIALRLRWNFAEGHQNIKPEDFQGYRENKAGSGDERQEAERLLEELYATCATEASKLKKIAHRKWWQLHHESTNCSDRKKTCELRRQMEQLELVWGRSQ